MVSDTKLYDILCIKPSATLIDIKKSYRQLAIIHHPDKGGNSNKFKEISNAYEILSDTQKRSQYDRFGIQKPNSHMHNFFNNFQGFNIFRSTGVNNPIDILQAINVTIKQIYNGDNINIIYNKNIKCVKCNGCGSISGKTYKCNDCNGNGLKIHIRQLGPGMVQQMQIKCDKCKGLGETINSQDMCNTCNGIKHTSKQCTYILKLQKGLVNGTRLALHNEGNYHNNSFSKLIITVNINNSNSIFERRNNNLCTKINISLCESLIGFTHTIKDINNNDIVIISPSVKHKDIKTMKGKGMPIFNTNNYGDLIIEFNVIYPSNEFISKNKENITKFLNP